MTTATPQLLSRGGRLRSQTGPQRPVVDEVVLLGGSVRPSELRQGLKRSPLDLPIAPQWSLLDGWRQHCKALAGRDPESPLPVTVLVDEGTNEPVVRNPTREVEVRVKQDPDPFRGTAGVLRDVYGNDDPNRLLLVGTAMQILSRPLIALVRSLVSLSADVALMANKDGTPTGLMLVRCGVLRCVPEVGFFDLKEQGLPAMAGQHRVKVLTQSAATGLPVRTRSDYISGLAALHSRADDLPYSGTPMAETWRPGFALVEQGATVDPSAKLHDSVVLGGAHVEADALIVRSVVGPGARVRRGQAVIDRMHPSRKDRS